MRILVYSLFMVFLLSACATTGVNTVDESQVVLSEYQGPPPGSTLKCQCGSAFTAEDIYFP